MRPIYLQQAVWLLSARVKPIMGLLVAVQSTSWERSAAAIVHALKVADTKDGSSRNVARKVEKIEVNSFQALSFRVQALIKHSDTESYSCNGTCG